uniref:Ig-like domain-containing protein n=1 Tax=Zonotrichia albicollis TaxID=44394 RepID=A0A8D2MCQ8_ZONAL
RSPWSLLCPTPAGVPPSDVSLTSQSPRAHLALRNRLVLSCTVTMGTDALCFSWHQEGLGALLGTGPHLELHHVGDNDSGQYRGTLGLGVTPPWHPHPPSPSASPVSVPTVPVDNATITPGPLSYQVYASDNVTLRCLVQVGSAPVTFTWLHNGQEAARSPILELRSIDVGHSGTYQCMATNQLGQDVHCVFRALSPELALEVSPRSPWVTGGVTQGLGIGDQWGFERPVGGWSCRGPRKDQGSWCPHSPFPCSCQEAPEQVSEGLRPGLPFPTSPDTPRPLIPTGPPQRRGLCSIPTLGALSGQGVSTGGEQEHVTHECHPHPGLRCHSPCPHGHPSALPHLRIHK